MYRRSREKGTRYVRGLPGSVAEDPETGELIVHAENTLTGKQDEYRLDLRNKETRILRLAKPGEGGPSSAPGQGK